tara:strand:- start:431 stop:1858 length:1428 start_codon:yes stop_codon:yes gene_type:complete
MTLSYKIHTATTGDVTGQPLGYSFNFPSLSANDITVTVGGNTKTITTDYTVENWTADAGNNPYIKFTSSTARGSGTIRISRGTTSTSPTHDFQVGSAIKAADLNSCNQQNIYLAQENRDSINALALGDASSAIQIDSANIKNLTIQAIDLATDAVETDKIKNLNVTTGKINNLAVTEGKIADNNVTANKLKSSSSTDSDRAVTTNHIRDGAVTDVKLSTISGSKITPNFGNQNISTTGTLNAGTTTTGTTTAQDLTITNNLTLSDGNADNKGIYFNGDPLGGNDDKAFLRYYSDTGTNGDTRLHLGCLGDTNDEIYLESHKVHTSNNLEVGGTCTANSFSGNGSGLSGLGNVKQIYEASSTGSSSTSSSVYADKLTLSVSTSSNTRVIVFYSWEMKHSSTNNQRVYAKFTGSNDSPVGGDREFSQNGTSLTRYEGHVLDIGSHSGTRTYKIQWRRNTSGNGLIQNAYLVAVAFNV